MIICFLLCFVILAVCFALYSLPMGAVLYSFALCFALMLAAAYYDYKRALKKHRALMLLRKLPENMPELLKPFNKLEDMDYIAIIEEMAQRDRRIAEENSSAIEDMTDYYTTWAHQVKTPISAIRLAMQDEDSARSRLVKEEVFKIEKYVDMVLTYIRLNSDSSDYVFRLTDIDRVIKKTLRDLASQFISRGLKLEYEPVGIKTVTDEKWLGFVIEQILSNALKYTPEGSISIYKEEPMTLCIRDTGIGIPPEELPRIFEKGYTGSRGREISRTTGLGLYLCKRVCDKLECSISVLSAPGEGTAVKIDLFKKSVTE